jgi:hypothetical protein
MTQREYHDWRADQAEANRQPGNNSMAHGPAPMQFCSACGLCERAGGFCSHQLPDKHATPRLDCADCVVRPVAEYDLTAHLHIGAQVCPLRADPVSYISVVGVYHHLPGASLARFRVPMRPVPAGKLANLVSARARQAVAS